MLNRPVIAASKVLVLALAIGIGAPWALSGEDAGPSVADWDGDGKVSATEQARYDWLVDQIELDDRGLAARKTDAQEGHGDDLELRVHASYLPPEEWRTLAEAKGANRSFKPLPYPHDEIDFRDRKGPLPVEFWAAADGFERHVFTAEIRIQVNKKDDPSDDEYLIDVYDPSRGHGDAAAPRGETQAVREDFNRFSLTGETVTPDGKERPKSAFGKDYQLVEGGNIKNGSAAVVFSIGSFAESAYALTVSRTARGGLRGQLWVSREFEAEQQRLKDEVEAAKQIVRADLAAREE